MKKHKICKILLVILAIFLCVAFYELLGICVAYKKQPEVSNTTKKETKNGSWNECSENTERAVIIEKNPEALLQRVRLIKNAKKEIILSTFAFQSDESGKLILGALHDAADRGVHIRLLVDGMESWIDMEGNPYFYGLHGISRLTKKRELDSKIERKNEEIDILKSGFVKPCETI